MNEPPPVQAENGIDPAVIHAHLADILASPAFKSSQRSNQFLQYVVTHTLEGRLDLLKERLIGERIFGRTADYDTGQDSIVRVKANEVRRRLSQYYEVNPTTAIRIQLPSGSYVAQITKLAPVPEGQVAAAKPEPTAVKDESPNVTEGSPAPTTRLRRWMILLGSLAAMSAVAFIVLLAARGGNSVSTEFWKPFVSGPGNLLICVATPEAYRIYGKGRTELVKAFPPHDPAVSVPATRPAPPDFGEAFIVPEPGMLVGFGDARALAQIHSYATIHGASPQFRMNNITSFSELKAGPAILIGGASNQWTVDLTRGQRFTIDRDGIDGPFGVRDNHTGKMICTKPRSWQPASRDDCAIITRLVDAKTGHPLLIAAGLDHFGTFAVGEFLTQPALLDAGLAQAPEDWAAKNLQVLLRVERVHDNIGPPQVVAIHTW